MCNQLDTYTPLGRRTASARSPARNRFGLALPTGDIKVPVVTLREYMLPLLLSEQQSAGSSQSLTRASKLA